MLLLSFFYARSMRVYYIISAPCLQLGMLAAQPMSLLKMTRHIQILDNSQLYLQGKSNVNEFTCYCAQEFVPIQANFSLDDDQQIANFPNLKLNLYTQNLDCGNKRMNKDLQKTLQVDKHPFIEIDLEKVYLNSSNTPLNQYWTHYLADTDLTIVGNTCAFKIPVMAKRVGEQTYQFKSFYEIRLSEFGIEAPSALLGMIKVKDTFMIHFDLYVEVVQ